MICPSCGKSIAEGSKFCPYCGTEIHSSSDASLLSKAQTSCNNAKAALQRNDCIASLTALRTSIDLATKYLVTEKMKREDQFDLKNRIEFLRMNQVLSSETSQMLNTIRMQGNDAVHEGAVNISSSQIQSEISKVEAFIANCPNIIVSTDTQVQHTSLNVDPAWKQLEKDNPDDTNIKYINEYADNVITGIETHSDALLGPNFEMLVEALLSFALQGYDTGNSLTSKEKLHYISSNEIFDEKIVELLNHSLDLIQSHNRPAYSEYGTQLINSMGKMLEEYSAFANRGEKRIYRESYDRTLSGRSANIRYNIFVIIHTILAIGGDIGIIANINHDNANPVIWDIIALIISIPFALIAKKIKKQYPHVRIK